MIYRKLGKSGIDVSVIGLGTWAIGGTWWGGTDEDDSIAAIEHGLDCGINLIDTAPGYGFGLSEVIVGKAIKGYDRSKLVIATKVGLIWHTEEGYSPFEVEGKKIYKNLKPAMIRYEIEQSLTRLDVDYIDLYQTHWPDLKTPIAETMAELLKLKDEGKIRAIGVSNVSVPQMQEYLDVGQIDSSQPLYNMLDREIEDEELPFCRANDIGVLSYSSLGMGLLTGKMTPDRKFAATDYRKSQARFAYEPVVKINAMLDQFAPLREKYGVTQTQLTAAWTLAQPGITSALVGVRNPAQADEIILAGDVVLDPTDLAAMDRVIDELEI